MKRNPRKLKRIRLINYDDPEINPDLHKDSVANELDCISRHHSDKGREREELSPIRSPGKSETQEQSLTPLRKFSRQKTRAIKAEFREVKFPSEKLIRRNFVLKKQGIKRTKIEVSFEKIQTQKQAIFDPDLESRYWNYEQTFADESDLNEFEEFRRL